MRRSHLILALFIFAILAAVVLFFGYIPARASMLYGPPARSLSISDRIEYSTRLLSHGDLLVAPLNPNGGEQPFRIEQGESIFSVATRLEQSSLIVSAQAFYDYVVYTGLDLTIQAGDYTLSPSMSIIDLARELQDSTPEDVTFVILPGWRLEEIAASLPTSGLEISPEAFISSAGSPPQVLDISSSTMEGFFYPDSYRVPRSATVDQLLDLIARNFVLHITDEMRAGFAAQELDLYQAVTLASIVERESIQNDEQALIASVFLNRLKVGMTLGSDPTVQYALGYDSSAQTWWKNPLSLDDLKFDSPYNTYIYAGLPPAPISNPSLGALQAVAFPETSPYYYFQATCDGSGYHTFAVTFEEHLANGCQ
ncbi:Endolytic murein transglycosylase [Anaerolineales bacterium]|nr:Endolytic murein transglycosylase [Anaerolineales bacterium]